jgi:hypothetical protein
MNKIGVPLELPWADGLTIRAKHVNLTRYGAKVKYQLPFSSHTTMLRPWQIENDYKDRPTKRPTQDVVQQGKWECMPAALAMLTGHTLFTIKRALGRHGWRNDNGGCGWEAVLPAIRDLGFDMIWLDKKRMYMLGLNEVPKCIVTVPSLNYYGHWHALTWLNGEILDPNMDRPGRLWYGAEWNPHTIGATGVEVLIKRLPKIKYLDLESMALAGKDDELLDAVLEVAV